MMSLYDRTEEGEEMGAAMKLREGTLRIVKESLDKLNVDEKAQVLDWSQKAFAIRENKSLPMKAKLLALSKLETPKVTKTVLLKVFEAVKNKIWTNQSWARRLGVLGLTAGGISFGGTGVGIATLGAGIGMPLMLLTAGGGVILGAVIDELKKEL